MTTNPYIGSSLDDLLEEDGILDEVEAIALKRVLAWQVSQAMQEQGITKTRNRRGAPTCAHSRRAVPRHYPFSCPKFLSR